MTTIHGVTVYVASPPASTSTQSNSKIIYFPDALGHTFANNQLLADIYATRTGMQVLIPDVIPGGGLTQTVLPLVDLGLQPVPWWNLLGQVIRIVTWARIAWAALPWMMRARPRPAMPTILDFARAVKEDLSPDGKLGVCGFCWGGYPSTVLCAETVAPGSTQRLVDAQFCAHPSFLDVPTDVVKAVETFKVPYAMAAAEYDFTLTPKHIEETEAELRQKVGRGDGENGCYYELEMYKNCRHGFAVRAKPGDKVEMEGAERACEQAIAWFKRWL